MFKSTTRHPLGTQIPLCSATMESEIGYLPKHVVKTSAQPMDSESKCCAGCSQSFGLFLWRSNCVKCGGSSCNDCLGYRFVPDHVNPVQVCSDCSPKVDQDFKDDWIKPLEMKEVRYKVTGQYLSLIHELGYADQAKLLELAKLFFEDQRYDLALQCTQMGKGDWMHLAGMLVAKKEYRYAKICLNFIENKSKEWWEQQGNVFAKTNPMLALMAFQKANYKGSDYLEEAFASSDERFSELCFQAASQCTEFRNDPNRFLDRVFNDAINQKKISLAIYVCLLRNYSYHQWIEFINKIDVNHVESFIHCMNAMYSLSPYVNRGIHFASDRDHYRWQFTISDDFDNWLGYLIESFEKGDYKKSIPYFRSKMRNENFIVRRDEYIAKGEYDKALLCHNMVPNGISYLELAKKLRQKNATASFACHLASTDDIMALGDKMFNEGDYVMALHCYLQIGNYARIEEKAKTTNQQVRLLYQIALWKHHPEQRDVILGICKDLLKDPNKQQAVQHILLNSLRYSQNNENVAYHKLLASTGISDIDLVGLLDIIFSLCKNPTDKGWLDMTLIALKSRITDSFRRAIVQGSLKDAVTLLDLINPMTLTAVRRLLAEFKNSC